LAIKPSNPWQTRLFTEHPALEQLMIAVRRRAGDAPRSA